jgi:hypothetical protein
MLIDSPEFHLAVREGRCYLPQERTEMLFEVALRLWISCDVAWARLAPLSTNTP